MQHALVVAIESSDTALEGKPAHIKFVWCQLTPVAS